MNYNVNFTELKAGRYMVNNRISWSQFSQFINCPYQWKLNYIDKVGTRTENIYLLFGTSFHEVLQAYLFTYFNKTVREADEMPFDKMLRERMAKNFRDAKERTGENPCSRDEMDEFFNDGMDILNFIQKHKNDYFSKKGYELVGIEMPLEVLINDNLQFVGYLDVVVRDKLRGVIKIYDIKTSTHGWNKWMKADEKKTDQLLLYKKYFSEHYNLPVEKIEVEFFIVKRKLYENFDFPQKRVQKVEPTSGKIKMKQMTERFNRFIKQGFDGSGNHTDKELMKIPSKKNCKFCEFKGTDYCK